MTKAPTKTAIKKGALVPINAPKPPTPIRPSTPRELAKSLTKLLTLFTKALKEKTPSAMTPELILDSIDFLAPVECSLFNAQEITLQSCVHNAVGGLLTKDEFDLIRMQLLLKKQADKKALAQLETAIKAINTLGRYKDRATEG
jgi:hypothetical protein